MEILNIVENVNVQMAINSTAIVNQNNSGVEQRIIQHKYLLRTFTFYRDIVSDTLLTYLRGFHDSVKGSQETFLYTDKSDNYADHEPINSFNTYQQGLLYPKPDGVIKDFQLCKGYYCGDNSYIRPITQPDVQTINIPDYLVGWTVLNNGQIRFGSAPIASNNYISAEFFFHVPVRFESDKLDDKFIIEYKNNKTIYSLQQLALREVKFKPYQEPEDTFEINNNHIFQVDLYRDSVNSKEYQTYIIEQSSGFEDRTNTLDNPIYLLKLQDNRLITQDKLNYLITLYLCSKGRGGHFRIADKTRGDSVFFARFNNQGLTYTNQSFNNIYQINGLELRVFVNGILHDLGCGGPTENALFYCQIFKITLEKINNNDEDEIFAYTTHDRELIIDGITYHPNNTLDPFATEKKIDLSADNQTLKGILNIDIPEGELFAQRFKDAELVTATIDWSDLPETLEDILDYLINYGVVGKITSDGHNYTIEYISKANSLLRRKRTIRVEPNCNYQFGDDDCKFNINNAKYETTVSRVHNRRKIEITNRQGDLRWGSIKFLSGVNKGISIDIYDNESNSNVVNFWLLLPYLPSEGDTIEVTKGCAKNVEACKGWNNFINFGGVPFLAGNDFYYQSPIERS